MAEKKSQFSVTCSLLSQYLKEKGSFGSIGLEMAPKPLHQQPKENYRAPTTLSLLPGVDVSSEDQTDKSAPKSMELFPQHAGFDSTVLPSKQESIKIKEAEKAQLTIFYGGKVLVFNDFPAEKAKDLLQMAGKEIIAAQKLGFSAAHSSSTGVDSSTKANSIFTSTVGGQAAAAAAAAPPNGLPKPAQANASADMPIARRNSLHRFLEKRKDRISTKAPYQVHGGEVAKPEDNQPWLELGRQAVKQEHSS